MRWPGSRCLPQPRRSLAAGPAAAERLIASLSNRHVMITSNYTGVELVLFGSVERDAASVARNGPYDIVATVTGPRETLRVRHKSTRARHLGQHRGAHVRRSAVLSRRAGKPAAGFDRQRREPAQAAIGLADTPLPELINNDIGEVTNDPFRGRSGEIDG